MRRWTSLIYLAVAVGSVALATVQPAQMLDSPAVAVVDTLTAR